jgi:hypothetical protein
MKNSRCEDIDKLDDEFFPTICHSPDVQNLLSTKVRCATTVGRNTITQTSTHGLSFGKVNGNKRLTKQSNSSSLFRQRNLTKLQNASPKILNIEEVCGVETVQVEALRQKTLSRD